MIEPAQVTPAIQAMAQQMYQIVARLAETRDRRDASEECLEFVARWHGAMEKRNAYYEKLAADKFMLEQRPIMMACAKCGKELKDIGLVKSRDGLWKRILKRLGL